LRIGLVVVGLAAWFLTQSLIGSRAAGEGIGDGLHDLSRPLHAYLATHVRVANGVLIASSAGIDVFGLFLASTVFWADTVRPFVALLMLFAFRQFCQAVCTLPVPKDMIWRHPGVPSLLVTYHVANDFFISGHTAIAVLGAIEVARLFPGPLAWVAGGIAVLEAATVIVLRAHYTMDVLGAITAALCASGLAAWLCG